MRVQNEILPKPQTLHPFLKKTKKSEGDRNRRRSATIYSFGATLRLLEYWEFMESTTPEGVF